MNEFTHHVLTRKIRIVGSIISNSLIILLYNDLSCVMLIESQNAQS